LSNRPVKFVAAYITPTKTLDDTNVTKCLSGISPILIAHALSSNHLPVIYTNFRSSFHDLMHCPDFKEKHWATFKANLEARLPGNPTVNDKETTDKFLDAMISPIQTALEASATMLRQCTNPRPPPTARIEDEICLKV
jgi:hypothetical protein